MKHHQRGGWETDRRIRFRGRRKQFDRLCRAASQGDRDGWNAWRQSREGRVVNLRGARLRNLNLSNLDLRRARLDWADLTGANLWHADLRDASLRYCRLDGALLPYAGMNRCDLFAASLVNALLNDALLAGANLSWADLRGTSLCRADLRNADLRRAALGGTNAQDCVIDAATRQGHMRLYPGLGDPYEDLGAQPEPRRIFVSVSDLETASLLQLVSRSEMFQRVIDAAAEHIVLLLGRFTRSRLHVLKELSGRLEELGYIPVIFNFAEPRTCDTIETISTLAGLSRFVIADLTNPKSTPLESHAIIPHLMIPFATIIRRDQRPFAMFEALAEKYEWVLPTVGYGSEKELVRLLPTAVVARAERMRTRLLRRRTGRPKLLPLTSKRVGRRARRP